MPQSPRPRWSQSAKLADALRCLRPAQASARFPLPCWLCLEAIPHLLQEPEDRELDASTSDFIPPSVLQLPGGLVRRASCVTTSQRGGSRGTGLRLHGTRTRELGVGTCLPFPTARADAVSRPTRSVSRPPGALLRGESFQEATCFPPELFIPRTA